MEGPNQSAYPEWRNLGLCSRTPCDFWFWFLFYASSSLHSWPFHRTFSSDLRVFGFYFFFRVSRVLLISGIMDWLRSFHGPRVPALACYLHDLVVLGFWFSAWSFLCLLLLFPIDTLFFFFLWTHLFVLTCGLNHNCVVLCWVNRVSFHLNRICCECNRRLSLILLFSSQLPSLPLPFGSSTFFDIWCVASSVRYYSTVQIAILWFQWRPYSPDSVSKVSQGMLQVWIVSH